MKYLGIASINAFIFIGLIGMNLTDDPIAIAAAMTASGFISLKMVFW